jgi:hypothetical protein
MSDLAKRIVGEAEEQPELPLEPQQPQSGPHMSQAMKDIALDTARNITGHGIVKDFDIDDRGIDNSQYFQGASARDYDAVFIGIGNNAHEALDDALEQAAMEGWEVGKIPNVFDPEATDMEDHVREYGGVDEEGEIDYEGFEDMHYYVVLRLSGTPPK